MMTQYLLAQDFAPQARVRLQPAGCADQAEEGFEEKVFKGRAVGDWAG